MNVQRLVSIAGSLRRELRSVPGQVSELVVLVETAINGPNETSQRAVETQFQKLRTDLGSAPSNDFSPGTRMELAELQVGDTPVSMLIGKGLSRRLEQVLAGSYTSVQTLDQLRAIAKEMASFQSALESAATGLNELGVPAEDLDTGASVVGMTVPRSAVDAGLLGLEKEVRFFGHFLLELGETVEGKVQDPKVHSLQSSDFGIDVNTSINLAGVFALIMKGTKMAWDGLKKYRDLRKQAEEVGVRPELADQLSEEGAKVMETAIDGIHLEVIQKYCVVKDGARSNELSNALKLRINGLANRMDRGFTFEVRTNPPPDATEEQKAMVGQVSALTAIRFEPIVGPRLLSLPEVEEKEQSKPPSRDGGKKQKG